MLCEMPWACRVLHNLTRKAAKVLQPTLLKPSVALHQQKHVRLLCTSSYLMGLDEFFDNPKNFGKRNIKSGAPWSKDLLRRKSLEDLQKLWFILLKERNMLQTMEVICLNEDEPMSGEDRLEKVAESMSNLRDVITEREKAKNMLLKGRPEAEPGEWRKSPLGDVYYYRYKEHLIPKEMQKIEKGDRPADMAHFNNVLEEWHLRREEKRIKVRTSFEYRIGLKWRLIRQRNPSMPKKPPLWFRRKFKTTWKYGIHPDLPLLMPPQDYRFNKSKPETEYP